MGNSKKVVMLIFMIFLFMLSACSKKIEGKPPEAIVKINGEIMETEKGTYEWHTNGNSIIADAASPYQIAEEMQVKVVEPNSAATIEFSNGTNPKLHAFIWTEQGRSEELAINGNKLTLPTEKRKYVIEIIAEWPNGEASYTIVVEIK